MSQPIQIKYGLPNGDWCAIDNSAAPAFPTFNAGTHVGYDTTTPGPTAQGLSAVADTGTGLLGSVTDTVPNSFKMGSVVGNPVSNIAPTGKVLTVLNNST